MKFTKRPKDLVLGQKKKKKGELPVVRKFLNSKVTSLLKKEK